MFKHFVFCIMIVVFGLSANAETVNLKGKVTDKDGNAIKNAILTLVRQNMKDTTGTDGMYEIKRLDVAVVQQLQPKFKNFIVEKDNLVFSLPGTTPIQIEVFNVKGNLLKRIVKQNVSTGFYRFSIRENVRAYQVLIIKVSIGSDTRTFRYLSLQNGNFIIDQVASGNSATNLAGLMKIAAIDDTLKITADGYKDKVVPITSYEMDLNITLEANSTTPPDTGRSVGCGKSLSDLKTGQYSITVAGTSRKYLVVVPDNYKADKPYKLLFGMHCMNGNMDQVKNDGFYRLQQFDKDKNFIWIAPEGTKTSMSSVCNNCDLWKSEANDNSDHVLFDALLNLAKEKLCIDTARVFSVGFSFGAMFSYSLSTNHQQQLRAVVTYAPANYNIYLPTNKHEPVAYMQTTGLSDGTCPWDQGGRGGKYCVIGHAKDNGCTNSETVDTWTSGEYKAHDFKGCKEGYPVKIVTFNGGHSCDMSWAPKMTWDFINQF
ncbi:MAG: hypothetical protein ACM31E_05805 [Fibrobacterota bacterium]